MTHQVLVCFEQREKEYNAIPPYCWNGEIFHRDTGQNREAYSEGSLV